MVDFYLGSNNDTTVHIMILDDQRQPLAITPGSIGHFMIAPAAPAGVAQSTMTPIFMRDTTGPDVMFNNSPSGSIWWYLDCLILHSDTVSLAAGNYYYEARVDLFDGALQYTIKSGIFTLQSTVITP